MRIEYKDRSYIEITRSRSSGKVFITMGARQDMGAKELSVYSVELSYPELASLLSDVYDTPAPEPTPEKPKKKATKKTAKKKAPTKKKSKAKKKATKNSKNKEDEKSRETEATKLDGYNKAPLT
jgi:hypothetical protein